MNKTKKKDSKKPRKVAGQDRAQFTVSSILEAAARILSKDGIYKFSTNQIAKIAGVSVGSLYEYFPNKLSIIGSLVENRINHELELILKKLKELSDLPLEVGCPLFVEAVVNLYRPNPTLDATLIDHLYSTGLSSHMQMAQDKVVVAVTEMIKGKKDEVQIQDPPFTAFILVHTLHAVIHSAAKKNPELLYDPKFVSEVSKLLLSYIKAETLSESGQ